LRITKATLLLALGLCCALGACISLSACTQLQVMAANRVTSFGHNSRQDDIAYEPLPANACSLAAAITSGICVIIFVDQLRPLRPTEGPPHGADAVRSIPLR
jgi:hypothetical protein